MTDVDYRYARALLIVAKDKDKIEVFQKNIKRLEKIFETNPQLTAAIKSPNVERGTKKRIVKRLFSKELDRDLLNFIMLVIDKGRQDRLGGITKVFNRLADRQRGILTAVVVTARELEQDQREELKTRLSQAYGVTVKLEERIDKNILGGIVVKFGDILLDGSLRQRLEAVKDTLYSAAQRTGVMEHSGP